MFTGNIISTGLYRSDPSSCSLLNRILQMVSNEGFGPKGMEEDRGKSEVIHNNLACDGYIESTCCFVQAIFLGMETKVFCSLLWFIQRYLIMHLKL
jgi:hypothetical protein